MYKLTSAFQLLFITTFLFILNSCGDSEPSSSNATGVDVLINEEVMDITFAYAKVKGTIVNPDSGMIIEHGVCYSTSPNPDFMDTVIQADTGFEFFTCFLFDLEKNTTYYVRSFVHLEGFPIVYSNEISFATDELIYECSPATNNIWGQDFTMSTATVGLTFGEFVIKGQGLTSDLSIEFENEPRSGVYWTVGADAHLDSEQCAIILSRSFRFYADNLSKVNVENLGDNSYRITFCDMLFQDANGNEFVSDGDIRI